VLLGVCALGVTTYTEEVDVVGMFRKDTDSTDGFKTLSSGFPKGALYPNTVLTDSEGAPLQSADLAKVQAAVKTVPGIAQVSVPTAVSKDRRAVTFAVTFVDDPFSDSALDRVKVVRAKIAAAAPPMKSRAPATASLHRVGSSDAS
jgi:hypothetical protein